MSTNYPSPLTMFTPVFSNLKNLVLTV